MCDGRSWPSWTISSARSVSQTSIPSRASASLSSISWVAIDLTLTTSVAPAAFDERGDDRVRLGRVARPVDDAAGRGHVRARAASSSSGRSREDLVLDRRAGEAELLPVGDARRRPRPASSRIVVVARPRFARSCAVGEGGPGGLRERRRAGERRRGLGGGAGGGSRSPSRVGRRGEDLGEVHDPDRRAAPRQQAADVHQARRVGRASAPRRRSRRTSSTLSSPIAIEVSAFFTANVPPNPQHSSAPRQVDEAQALDRGEQPLRPVADPQQPQRVAGRVERDRVREARADVGRRRGRRRGTRSARGPAARPPATAVGQRPASPRSLRRPSGGGGGPSPRTTPTA